MLGASTWVLQILQLVAITGDTAEKGSWLLGESDCGRTPLLCWSSCPTRHNFYKTSLNGWTRHTLTGLLPGRCWYSKGPSFYPRPVLALFWPVLAGYCRCPCPSVRPSVTKFVRAITHHPFKLGSPNLDQRCKTPWLRSLSFQGPINLWPSRSNLRSKSKFTPFWVCPHHNSSPIQARITKCGPEMRNTLVKIPIVLRDNWLWPSRSNLS